MNHLQKKSKTNVLLLSILSLILAFLIVNTIQVPLLAGSVSCGEGSCSCSCVGGYCDCISGPGEQCYCTCSFPSSYDYCSKFKEGPELPGD